MSHKRDEGPRVGAVMGGAGIALLMVLCCAAPILIAGGALAGIGGVLSNPWLIAAGVTLFVSGSIDFARRGEHIEDDCCTVDRKGSPGSAGDAGHHRLPGKVKPMGPSRIYEALVL